MPRSRVVAVLMIAMLASGCAAKQQVKAYIPRDCIRKIDYSKAKCTLIENDWYDCSGVKMQSGCVRYQVEKK